MQELAWLPLGDIVEGRWGSLWGAPVLHARFKALLLLALNGILEGRWGLL